MRNPAILLAMTLLTSLPAGQVLAQASSGEATGHASSQVNIEMLRMASATPERFIGKMLVMSDRRKAGEILSVRRRISDKALYLVIQAEPYFKRQVEFAVPVLDVDRMESDSVVLNEVSGNFLRGVEYKAAEFRDINAAGDAPLVVDE